jgi:aquaporin Z
VDTTTLRKLYAELIGTFVLVFFGVGTAILSGGELVPTAFAFGISVLAMAYAVGHISGGHFNPAVSVGAAVSGRLAWSEVLSYVVAQVIGGLLAALVLWLILTGVPGFDATGHFGQNGYGEYASSGIAWGAAFLAEAVATAIFLAVILAVTDSRNSARAAAPVAIGLALTGIHLARERPSLVLRGAGRKAVRRPRRRR